VKGNTKGSMVGPRKNPKAEKTCFPSLGAFKTSTNLWEGGEPGDFHPIINEWGRE
jgi:hypothetical protein